MLIEFLDFVLCLAGRCSSFSYDSYGSCSCGFFVVFCLDKFLIYEFRCPEVSLYDVPVV